MNCGGDLFAAVFNLSWEGRIVKNIPLRRNWVLTLSILAAAVVFVGTDLVWGYVQGVRGLVQQQLRDVTTIQMDLARLDQQIEALMPHLAANRKKVIAGQIFNEEFAEETADLQNQQIVAMAEMEELRAALDASGDSLMIDGVTYSREAVESDLSRRLSSHQNAQERLEGRRQMLARREQSLERLDQQIRQDEWEVAQLSDLANDLNERLRATEIAEETGDLQYNKTELTEARDLGSRIERELTVMARFQEYAEQESRAHGVPVNLDRRTAATRFDEYKETVGQ